MYNLLSLLASLHSTGTFNPNSLYREQKGGWAGEESDSKIN